MGQTKTPEAVTPASPEAEAPVDPLEAWAHAGVHEVELPSGAGTATTESLDLIDWVAFGSIVNPLRALALQAEAGTFNPEEASDDDLQTWSNLKAAVVAKVTKKLNGKDVNLDPDWVRDVMPKNDRDRIFATATHVLLPNQRRGLMAVQSFRDLLGGLVTAQNGDGNGESAE
jgi:hypothetical protein